MFNWCMVYILILNMLRGGEYQIYVYCLMGDSEQFYVIDFLFRLYLKIEQENEECIKIS